VPFPSCPVVGSVCGEAATSPAATLSRPAILCSVTALRQRPEGWTMARWLRYWLTTRTTIRPTTLRSYEAHVERRLIPRLGRVRLSELAGHHITDMMTAIAGTDNRYGRTLCRRLCIGSGQRCAPH
jgi:hypothetical protein